MVTAQASGYSALLSVPGFPRVVAGTAVQRTGSMMLQVAIVLFVLQKFHSPTLAGVTVFLQIAPGLLISPIAGALLDRYGRVRLMLIDYAVAALTLAVIVVLSTSGRLVPALLLVLVTISSFTSILTITGIRSLFPLMVPRDLWDLANGLDSSLYAVTSIIGPPLAAGIVAVRGGDAALLACAAAFALAAVVMIGIREPRTVRENPASIWREAWDGLRYVVRNPTLRALAISISLVNLGTGGLVVSLPVLLLNRIHAGPAVVGQVWAVLGVSSLVSALIAGRLGTEGRERILLAVSMVAPAIALVFFAFTSSLLLVFAVAAVAGLFIGGSDVALFAIRQRRTDPAWFGRAFAVSMSLNYIGAPFGAALAGVLVSRSITLAFLVGAAFSAVAAVTTTILIPKSA